MTSPTLGTFKIRPSDLNGNSTFTYDGVTTELTFSDPTSNSPGAFTYTSFNTNYATVTKGTPNRLVLGIPGGAYDPLGVTIITATQAASGSYTSKSVSVTFSYVKQSVTLTNLTPNKTTVVGTLQPVLLTQTFQSVEDTSSVLAYSSSDITVATVGRTASVIDCKKLGTTSIEVTLDGIYSIGRLTFYFYVKSDYTLTPPTLPTSLTIGETYNAQHPTNVNPVPFTYTSSSINIATINNSGLITAGNKIGPVTITVSQISTPNYIEKSASATFTVLRTNTLNLLIPLVLITPTSQSFPVIQNLTSLTYTNSDALVTYSLVGTYAGVSLTDDQLTIEGDSYLGNVTVQAAQTASATIGSKTVTTTFDIVKQTAEIIPFGLGGYKVGDTFPIPTLSGDKEGHGSESWSTSTPNTISVANNTVICDNVGAASLTVTVADSATHFGASFTYNFVLSKGLPTITLNLPIIYFEGTKTFPLNPTSPSLGTYTYTTSTPNFVSFSDNTFTLLRANGVRVYVTATQAATDNYLAGSVTSSFLVIIGAPPSINVSLNGAPLGSIPNNAVLSSFPEQPCGTLFDIALSSDNTDGAFSVTSTTPSNVSISGTKVRLKAIGNASITITQARGFFYESSSMTFNVTIIRGLPQITFENQYKTYAPLATFTLSPATSLSTGVFTYTTNTPEVISVTGTTVTILKAGQAKITAHLTSDANYFSNIADSNLIISKATPVISNFSNILVEYEPYLSLTIPATSSNSETPIIFNTSVTGILTNFSGNQTTVLMPGSCVVRASQIQTENYFSVEDSILSSILVTILKSRPTVGNLEFPIDRKIGDGDDTFALTIPTSTHTETEFAFSSSNPLVATISGTTVTIVGAGSTIITAVQAGNLKYEETSASPAILNILPATGYAGSLYIPSKFYNDAPFQIVVPDHANNVDPILYSSSNETVATVSSTGLVTILKAGSSVITVSQAENANYSPTFNSSYTLEVFKKTLVVGLPEIGMKTYLDAPFFLSPYSPNSTNNSWTFSSSDPTVATITNVIIEGVVNYQVTILNTGTTFIQATQAADDNYNASVTNIVTLPVDLAVPTITLNTVSTTYVAGGTVTLFVTSNSAGGVLFTVPFLNNVLAVAANVATILNAGTTEITITHFASGSFKGRTLTVPFTVNKSTPNLTFEVDTTAYKFVSGGTILLDASSTTSTDPITYSSNNSVLTVDQNKAVMQSVGTGSITASVAATSNYNERSVTNNFFVVTGSANLRNFSIDPKIFTDIPFTLVAPTSDNEVTPFTYESLTNTVATVSGSTVTIVKAGMAVIKANQATSSFFERSSIETNLFISRVIPNLTFTVANQTLVAGEVVALQTTTPVVGGVITYTTDSQKILIDNYAKTMTLIEAGDDINITANLATSDNYDGRSVSTTFNIGKGTAPITFTIEDKLFVDNDFFTLTAFSDSSGTFTYTSTSPTISISDDVATMLDLGQVVITATQAADVNYVESVRTATFNILATLPDPEPTLTFSIPDITLSPMILPNRYEDYSYSLTWPDNYTTNSYGLITIELVGDYDSTRVNNINGHDIIFSPPFDLGTITVKFNQAAQPPMGAGTLNTSFVLSIAPNAVIDPFVITSKNVGDTFTLPTNIAHEDGPIAWSAFPIGIVTITNNTTVTCNSNGTVTLTATQANGTNYFGNSRSTSFNVTNATPIIDKVPSNLRNFQVNGKNYAVAPFTITAPLTDNDETEITYASSNHDVATVSGTTITVMGYGSTTISASQIETLHYLAEEITANFTVYKATPTFSSNWSIPSKQVGAASFQITNLTSTNTVTPITFTSSNTNVATISGTTVTVVGAGSTTVTASQASNTNYNTPTPVTTTFTVTDPTAPLSNICFLAGTPIQTDQGVFAIEKLDPERHTIHGNPIVGVTKTCSPDTWLVQFEPHALGENKPAARTVMSMYHKVEHEGVMTCAYKLLNDTTVTKVSYTGETLYNVLLHHHGTMRVNNMVCETLHPGNVTAKLFRLLNHLPWKEKAHHVRDFNAFCETTKIYENVVC